MDEEKTTIENIYIRFCTVYNNASPMDFWEFLAGHNIMPNEEDLESLLFNNEYWESLK